MNNKLKELTLEAHRNAERQKFAKILLSGKITPELYHQYLYNQYHIYRALEEKIDISEIENIKRHSLIAEDINELETTYNITPTIPLCDTTLEYVRYIQNLNDNSKLLAHLYVRHFGDMYGGQIIKKQVPGSGNMYNFENVEELKTKVRAMLSDDMHEEAILCFEYATKLFKELTNDE